MNSVLSDFEHVPWIGTRATRTFAELPFERS